MKIDKMQEKILIIAAHPDDETFGCGGSILKHKSFGKEVYWLIITGISTETGWPEALVARRKAEIESVGEKYEFSNIFNLNLPTTKLDTLSLSELIQPISETINKIRPTVIFLPNRSDIHTDHQIAFKAVMSCTKNFRFPSIKKILMYETLSETEFSPALPENAFIPNVFIDISPFFKRKLEIMNIYESELMKPPLPRSFQAVTSLAQFRGSRIGVQYAEAFMLLLEIE